MKVTIRNKERVYSGICDKCTTKVEEVTESEFYQPSIIQRLINCYLYPVIKCPNCKAEISLVNDRWKEKE